MTSNFTVKDIMTTSVLTVSPESTMREAAVLLVENAISGMPVVDSSGQTVGILSEKDVLTHLLDLRSGNEKGLYVRDYMNIAIWTLDADTEVVNAARILLDTNFGRLPVVENGAFVGLVSLQDFIQAMT